MSDRLQELLRQKALLDEHASWLAREIAEEQARSGASPAPAVLPAASPPAPSPIPPLAVPPANPPSASLDAKADAIIDQYRESTQADRQNVKRGCILYLIAALAFIALGVLAIHFMAHRK